MNDIFRRCHSSLTILLRAFLVLWLSCFAMTVQSSAQNQSSSVIVRVSDAAENPVFQAEVRLIAFGRGSFAYRGFTDGNGRVTLSGVTRGSYTLEVFKVDYETAHENIDVNPGTVENFFVQLHPRPDSQASVTASSAVSASLLAVPADARKDYEKGKDKMADDPAESVQYFRRAIKKYPNYAEAYTMLGLVYIQKKEYEEANQALTKALEINPKLALAQILLGKLYLEQRRFDEAEKLLLEGIRLDPKTWNGPYELARCYFNMGRLQEAQTYALRAHEMTGAPTLTHLLLVDIYIKQGNQQDALKELQEFARADPHSPLMPRVQKMMERLRKRE